MNKLNSKYMLFFALIFIVLFPYLLYHNTNKYTFTQGFYASYNTEQLRHAPGRNVPCLEYLKEGTLFEGQPFCEQGIMQYLTLYPFTFFGDNFGLAVTTFSFLLIFILFFYGNKIIKKESPTNILIYTLLFCLIFVILSLTWYATLLGTFFLFFAFYVLFYTNLKYKEVYAGILFTLCIFSKFTLITFIPFILSYYLYTIKKINFKLILSFLFPFLAIYLLFKLIWPNFFIYNFWSLFIWRLVGSSDPTSFVTIIKSIFPLSLDLILTLIIFLILLYLFYKNRKIIYFIPLVGTGLLYLFSAVYHRSYFLANGYYFLPTFLFISIILTIKLNLLKNKKIKYTIIVIVFLVLLLPSYKNYSVQSNFNEVQSLVTNIFEEIPIFEGNVLGNIPLKDLRNYGFKLKKEQYEYLPEYDLNFGMPHIWEGLKYFEILNETQWTEEVDNLFTNYSNKIRKGEYSLIIFSPIGHVTDFSKILLKATQNNELYVNYCVFKIPDMSMGLNIEPAIYLFLRKDTLRCGIYGQKIFDYYFEHMQEICEKSGIAGFLSKVVLTSTYTGYKELKCKYKEEDPLIAYYSNSLFTPESKNVNINEVSECYTLMPNNMKVGVGQECESGRDCTEHFNDGRAYFCEKSRYIIDYPLKICAETKECLNFYSHPFIKEFVGCNKNMCMYLGSHDEVAKISPPHEYPFPELSGFTTSSTQSTKEIFLEIAKDYVN